MLKRILKEKELADHLKRLEILLCRGELKKNPEELDKIIHDDFVEFGSSGRIWDKSSVIKSFNEFSNRECSLTEFKLIILAEDAALVTYKAVINKGIYSSESLRSSIWKKSGGEWKIIFHQGTPVEKFQTQLNET